MRVVGESEEKILIVLSRKHGVAPVYASRKESHAFVLHCRSVKGQDAEVQEIRGLNQLRENDTAVVGGVGCVVDYATIVFDKSNEAGILDAIALVRRNRKDNAFR